MTTLRLRWSHFSAAFLVLFMVGCTTGNSRSVRQARVAEERGDAHLAYDYYCNAAKQRPDDASIASSIKRLAPTAAAYWDSQARIAASQGNYGEAWRRGMKSLHIRPDEPGMVEFVAQVEKDHPAEVEPSRRQWMESGRIQVAAAPSGSTAGQPAPAPVERSEPVQTAYSSPPRGDDKSAASKRSSAVSRDFDRDDEEIARQARKAEAERNRREADRERRERDEARNREIERARREERERRDTSDEHGRDSDVARFSRSPNETEFAVLHTLSRDEDRHPKRVRLADGIYMKLRDIDDDKSADMDLDDGDDRVQKIRGLKVGQSKLFRGRSGQWFRFTLIEVRVGSETIRVGVKPA